MYIKKVRQRFQVQPFFGKSMQSDLKHIKNWLLYIVSGQKTDSAPTKFLILYSHTNPHTTLSQCILPHHPPTTPHTHPHTIFLYGPSHGPSHDPHRYGKYRNKLTRGVRYMLIRKCICMQYTRFGIQEISVKKMTVIFLR